MNKYLAPVFFIALGVFFLAFPWVAALLLGSLFLFIGTLYLWLVYKWNRNNQRGYTYSDGFESEVFSQGQPDIRNISVSVLKRF